MSDATTAAPASASGTVRRERAPARTTRRWPTQRWIHSAARATPASIGRVSAPTAARSTRAMAVATASSVRKQARGHRIHTRWRRSTAPSSGGGLTVTGSGGASMLGLDVTRWALARPDRARWRELGMCAAVANPAPGGRTRAGSSDRRMPARPTPDGPREPAPLPFRDNVRPRRGGLAPPDHDSPTRLTDMRPNTSARLTAALSSLLFLAAACARSHAADITATGTVELVETDVAPTVAGRVSRAWVDEGAPVRAGDTLMTLTSPTLPADLGARQARLARATAELRDLERGARREDLARAAAELRAAEAEAERTARDLS